MPSLLGFLPGWVVEYTAIILTAVKLGDLIVEKTHTTKDDKVMKVVGNVIRRILGGGS